MKTAVKKLTGIFLCLLAVLLVLSVGNHYFKKNYVVLNGKPYAKTTETLSFSGKKLPDLDRLIQLEHLKQLDLRNTSLSLGEHEWLQRHLPDCRIDWQVEFQGRQYLPDTKKISLSSLKSSDLVTLDFLPELREMDARDCRDYEVLGKLMEKRPDCRILTQAQLGNRILTQDTRELTIRDGDADQILEVLAAFPGLQKIEFTGKLPETRQLNRLHKAFPQVETTWQVRLAGKTYEKNTEALDLSLKTFPEPGILREKLLYFPYLKTVDFRGTELPEEEKKQLLRHFPQVDMKFDYELPGVQAGMETEILDLSGQAGITIPEIEKALPYLPNLQTILLCDCGLPNEELAALNERLPDIRVIWNVQVGGRNTRTDETYFAPNKWGLKMTDENIQDLRYCTDMVCVDIGHSKKVTNCRWAEYMPELKYLILADSNVRGLEPLRNLKKLQYLELFLIPGQDLSPLQGCTALEDLNLCYVYTDPAPILEMPWLKRLWWSGCWPAKNLLAGKLPNTEMNFDAASSTGEGWREGKLYYEMRDFIGMGYMKG